MTIVRKFFHNNWLTVYVQKYTCMCEVIQNISIHRAYQCSLLLRVEATKVDLLAGFPSVNTSMTNDCESKSRKFQCVSHGNTLVTGTSETESNENSHMGFPTSGAAVVRHPPVLAGAPHSPSITFCDPPFQRISRPNGSTDPFFRCPTIVPRCNSFCNHRHTWVR